MPAFVTGHPRSVHHMSAADRKADEVGRHDDQEKEGRFGPPSLIIVTRSGDKPSEQGGQVAVSQIYDSTVHLNQGRRRLRLSNGLCSHQSSHFQVRDVIGPPVSILPDSA